MPATILNTCLLRSSRLLATPCVHRQIGYRSITSTTGYLRPLLAYPRPTTRSFTASTSRRSSSKSSSRGSGIVNGISRAVSFSFYACLIVGGIGTLGIVGYLFVSEILLPSSDVALYNKTFSIIEKDPVCLEVLGDRIKAHGEEQSNKWARSRPIAANRGFDKYQREHMWMQFHVQGEKNSGLVRLEMVRDPHGSNTFEYRYLVLEVPGFERIYLIDKTPQPARKTASGLFWGIKWGKKQD